MSEVFSDRPLRVAVVGAGPAGVYAADLVVKAQKKTDLRFSVDLFDRYPAPFGLIRYGVAPDHPRIKGIVKALHKVLDRGDIRLLGNVNIGVDLTLEDLQAHYDAVIVATGAVEDAALDIPGIDLKGSFGAADFVSWYDGHPDYPRTWPLQAKEVAVLGHGNVALDVARVLAKQADDMLTTEIPEGVYQGLKSSQATDIRVLGRRGPAQVKFTPLELRELSHAENVEIVLDEEDFQFDDASDEAIRTNNQIKTMVNTLTNWLVEQEERVDSGEPAQQAARRLHIQFFHRPVEILEGVDADGTKTGAVAGIRCERMELDGTGNVTGTGEFVEYPVQAVYRAVGYRSSPLPGVPFNEHTAVIPNEAGRVLDAEQRHLPGLYTTGWIKRGPVGLIGHTKGDAMETVNCLVEDASRLPVATHPNPDAVTELLDSRGVEYTTWEGWHRLDQHEIGLGDTATAQGPVERERVKVVDREEMLRISRG